MPSSAQDLFYIILALCLLWLTVFICWALYYVIMMLRDVSKVTSTIRDKFELIDRILRLVKDKLENSSNHMATMSESIMQLVDHFSGGKKASSSRKRRS